MPANEPIDSTILPSRTRSRSSNHFPSPNNPSLERRHSSKNLDEKACNKRTARMCSALALWSLTEIPWLRERLFISSMIPSTPAWSRSRSQPVSRRHESRAPIIFSSVVSVAHLYNTFQQLKFMNGKWRAMTGVIEAHIGRCCTQSYRRHHS